MCSKWIPKVLKLAAFINAIEISKRKIEDTKVVFSGAGAAAIAVVAKTTDGKPATLTIGVMVGEWNSGSRITVWLIVLPIALAVGGALALPATRRRRRLRSAG